MPEIKNNSPLKLPKELADGAQSQLETWFKAVKGKCPHFILPPEIHAAVLIAFALSDFVSRTCLRSPDLLLDLIQSGDLRNGYLSGTHADRLALWLEGVSAGVSPPIQIGELSLEQMEAHLRRYRRREMVRVAIRDLAGWSDLQETLIDLSELAEACIQSSLSYLTDRYVKRYECHWGRPLLIVLGMGKLGAQELNFSSDVDLIFAFPDPDEEQEPDARHQAEEACLRIGRQLVQLLSRNTADGFVFRVDTRLRPYGESGPLVMSFDNLENYYQAQGREWERYAMIKARVVAGDPKFGKELINRLRPFVYRRYLDFGAFESIRDMKEKVRLEVRRKGMQNDIKLGAGGIREIEFFGQIFQLIRGGVIVELQDRRILYVLQILAQYQIISPEVSETLTGAYIFLRRTENRLQEMDDQQTHSLPGSEEQRLRLAFSMGVGQWADFERRLKGHRDLVHQHFSQLLGEKEDRKSETPADKELEKLRIIWQHPPENDEIVTTLEKVGFDQVRAAADAIARFRTDSHTRALSTAGRDRLNRLVPVILKEAASSGHSFAVLDRIFDLLKSIQRRTSYLSLLLEYPNALRHLVRLAEASPWIVSFLSRHPVLLDELLDPRTLYSPPTVDQLRAGLKLRLSQGPTDDFEYQMEALRIFKQVNTLRVAASDITGVLPLMKVSDRLTEIAQIILDQVVDFSWRYLVAKHGRPKCELGGKAVKKGFAVIAYGKLGGYELGYGSDLDLVFLHCATHGQTEDGDKPIDNTQFFARLGQRVIHILSAHTAAGVLYDVDMRLRPSGSAGVLVSHVDGFREYQLKDAWTWEHQALIRARAVCGDPALMERFEAVRREVLSHCIPGEKLKSEVADMRVKIRRQHPPGAAQRFDLKQGGGGLVDIEFLVQYLVLSNACRHLKLLDWTDNVRLLESLAYCRIVDELTAYRLRRAYLVYRAVIHRCNLQEKTADVDGRRFADLRQWVRIIWQYFFD